MGNPRLCFTVVSDVFRGREFVFGPGETITIGRTPDNAIALDHKSVSRRHARVEPDGAGFALVDLGSHNGTRIGDKLISKHPLRSGEVIGFGELLVRFTIKDDGAEGTQVLGASLPVLAAGTTQTGALARPLTFEDVFAQAEPTAPMELPQARRNYWPVLYGLLMAVVVVLGLLAFWAVGQKEAGPPKVDVLVRANEALPVDLSVLPARDRAGWMRGLSRIERIGTPSDQKVADADRTPFRTFVSVRGKTLGTTDIPVYGPPLGIVILRVLVRDVKPPPEALEWMGRPVAQRRDYALGIIAKARLFLRSGSVNSQTWAVAKDLDLAARLLEAIPGMMTEANWASQTAHGLRQALDKRYNELARDIDILREQGKYPEALNRAIELKSLFPDPESVEHNVVNMFYESLAREAAQAEREAQEKR